MASSSLLCVRDRLVSATLGGMLPLRLPLWFVHAALAMVSTVPLVSGQPGPPPAVSVREQVRAHRQQHEHEILRELRDLVALPNVASNGADIARNAAMLRQMLERRGFTTQVLTVPDAPPAVYGSLTVPGATRTVVFYAHYDGQPVDAGRLEDSGVGAGPAQRHARGRGGRGAVGRAAIAHSWRVSDLRTLDVGRQGPHRRLSCGPRCPEGRRAGAVGQRQGVSRRRGGGGVAEPRAAAARAPRHPASRRLDLRRRTRAPVTQGARVVRRARQRRPGDHDVRPGACRAQRSLRQLGAQSRGGSGAPADEHARRRGANPHQGVRGRRAAAVCGRARGRRGRAGRGRRHRARAGAGSPRGGAGEPG